MDSTKTTTSAKFDKPTEHLIDDKLQTIKSSIPRKGLKGNYLLLNPKVDGSLHIDTEYYNKKSVKVKRTTFKLK